MADKKTIRREALRICILILAAFVYSVGVNFFLVPAGLYTGGILGCAQLLRSFMVNTLHMNFGGFDIAGLIYYLINVPLLFIAHKLMGKLYFAKTIVGITTEALIIEILPVPSEPLVQDLLSAALIGGAITGAMMGLILRMGACDGGMDLVGVLIVHQKQGASVGNANLYLNIVLFAFMAFSYPLEIMIYSVLGAVVTAYALDHFFTQNINVEYHVITQEDPEGLEKIIQRELHRSVTKWEGTGTYSGKPAHILYVIVDKYESPRLNRLIREYDPTAFVVENSGVGIHGNFEKHIT